MLGLHCEASSSLCSSTALLQGQQWQLPEKTLLPPRGRGRKNKVNQYSLKSCVMVKITHRWRARSKFYIAKEDLFRLWNTRDSFSFPHSFQRVFLVKSSEFSSTGKLWAWTSREVQFTYSKGGGKDSSRLYCPFIKRYTQCCEGKFRQWSSVSAVYYCMSPAQLQKPQ